MGGFPAPRPLGVSRGLRGPGLQGPPGASRGLQGPSGASTVPGAIPALSGQVPRRPPCLKALTRRFAAARGQDPPRGASWRQTKNVGATAEGLGAWVWGIPIKGKINVHCIYLAYWGGWRQGCASRCTGSILHRLLPLSYPVWGWLTRSSVSDHPSNGWERPKQAGWEPAQGRVSMRRWRHPTSRDLWARPAPSELH